MERCNMDFIKDKTAKSVWGALQNALSFAKNHMQIISFFFFFGVFFLHFQIGGGWGWWHHKSLIHDDGDYFSHACTIALDQDFDYSNEASMFTYKARQGLPSNPVGPGLLAAPFVKLFSYVDMLKGHPFLEDRLQFYGSWTYFGFGFATSFYFMWGCYLFWLMSQRLGSKLSKQSILLLCFGSGVVHYVLFRQTMAHSYEFFTLALALYSGVGLATSSRNQLRWILLGAFGATLSWLSRYYAIYGFAYPVIGFLVVMLKNRLSFNKKREACYAASYAAALVFFVGLACLLQYQLYGKPMQSLASYGNTLSYLPEYHSFFQWSSEVLMRAITRLHYIPITWFGSAFPIVIFAPILFFGIIMLFIALWRIRKNNMLVFVTVVLLSLACVGIPYLIVMMWQMAGSAYGYRYLYGLIPLGMLGACLWNTLGFETQKLGRGFAIGLLVASLYATFVPLSFTTLNTLANDEPLNEFGVLEPGNPSGIAFKTLDHLFRAKMWGRAVNFSYAGMHSAISAGGPVPYHPNLQAQAQVLIIFWGTYLAWFFIGNKKRIYASKGDLNA